MANATAPGKIILFGEHAVVFGKPAIAVPVFQVHALATIEPSREPGVWIDAADLGRRYDMADASADDPLGTIIRLTCERLRVVPEFFKVRVQSTIPIARGLGSGAAVSVATARAVARFYGRELSADQASALAYQVETLHHGTPSGIDNTVIAYGQPVYFVRGRPFEAFRSAEPFSVVIGDTGVASSTRVAVERVRCGWEADPQRFDALFNEIGEVVQAARAGLEGGDWKTAGSLMSHNQRLLEAIGVSSPEIERLVNAALSAGALGAKLSGGGLGGNVIALVDKAAQERVASAWLAVGAHRVIVTRVE